MTQCIAAPSPTAVYLSKVLEMHVVKLGETRLQERPAKYTGYHDAGEGAFVWVKKGQILTEEQTFVRRWGDYGDKSIFRWEPTRIIAVRDAPPTQSWWDRLLGRRLPTAKVVDDE